MLSLALPVFCGMLSPQSDEGLESSSTTQLRDNQLLDNFLEAAIESSSIGATELPTNSSDMNEDTSIEESDLLNSSLVAAVETISIRDPKLPTNSPDASEDTSMQESQIMDISLLVIDDTQDAIQDVIHDTSIYDSELPDYSLVVIEVVFNILYFKNANISMAIKKALLSQIAQMTDKYNLVSGLKVSRSIWPGMGVVDQRKKLTLLGKGRKFEDINREDEISLSQVFGEGVLESI
ncbi:hypothetical protein B9Z19DRAFT_1118952 [Tuber borchii]|uniref:Uncharacterized protein n=1 Tax=Tuber borchii TaxID=42251 RepID=A0A2T7A7B4_TUBBO|nr:hypothetical protein B9Z19DRAFT_1118952 [Tuber borchii]